MATYGEGDPTDNAQDFYDWLQENDDEDLKGLNYTVSLRPRSASHSRDGRPSVLYLSVNNKNAAMILKIL